MKDELPMTMKDKKEKDKNDEILELDSVENIAASVSKRQLDLVGAVMAHSNRVMNEFEQLPEDQQEAEDEMMKSYWQMGEESKEAVVKDIPVKILQRIRGKEIGRSQTR